MYASDAYPIVEAADEKTGHRPEDAALGRGCPPLIVQCHSSIPDLLFCQKCIRVA